MTATADVPSDLQEQRRFSDAGVTAYQYDHPGQHAAAEHAVQLFNSTRQALSFVSADLGDCHWPCRGLAIPTLVAVAFHRRAFFDEAAPLLTLGTPPQPLTALIATALANV